MNWYFIAALSWYDPTTNTAISAWIREPHSSLEACLLAKQELWGLGKVRGACVNSDWRKLRIEPSRNAPGRFSRRFQLAAIHPPTEPLPATARLPRGK